MTRTVESQLRQVVHLVHDLMQQPHTTFPYRCLQPLLAELFHSDASWNWVNSPNDFDFVALHDHDGWPTEAAWEEWRAEGIPRHPLLRWYDVTRDPSPMTMTRVPTSIASVTDQQCIRSQLAPVGIEEQMPIICTLAPMRSFVVGRDSVDFTDAELDLAVRIQPLVMLLYRHVQVMSCAASESNRMTNAPLTPREIAVLALLAQGLTAGAIAHRLGASPRTVQKHLEHIYRKLAATDRVTAIRSALDLGLVDSRSPATDQPGTSRATSAAAASGR
jgi:DNA-binding CsgD family transcriptional regulator